MLFLLLFIPKKILHPAGDPFQDGGNVIERRKDTLTYSTYGLYHTVNNSKEIAGCIVDA
jgi:hypothetical protein